MATLIDSYSESNQNSAYNLQSTNVIKVGQSFTNSNLCLLDSCKFYILKNGTLSGNVVAKIYTHGGGYGSSSYPTGSALATSDNVDSSTLPSSFTLVNFVFSGINNIDLSPNTKYIVTIEYSGGGINNYISVGIDSTTPTASGNLILYISSWTPVSSYDVCFYVYGTQIPPTVTTQAVSSIASTTATGNGNVTADGGATVTERGVCWKTSSGPTTSDGKAYSGTGTGAYTVSMTGLARNTLYYAKAYAINSTGTSYGSEVTFTTLGFTNPGNIYSSNNTYATLAATSGILTVEVSKDAGANWQTPKTVTFTASDTLQTVGLGATELFGSSFTRADMVNANLRIRLSQGNISQVYKTFGFSTGSDILTGIEIAIEGKYASSTLSLDLLEVRIYYGTTSLPVQVGSQAFDSTNGTLAVYDGNVWQDLAFKDTRTITAPTLINSWSNAGGGNKVAGYWKDITGIVHLEGLITGGASGSTAFVLPAGYVPLSTEGFGPKSEIAILNNGNVICQITTTYLSLSGITFRTS